MTSKAVAGIVVFGVLAAAIILYASFQKPSSSGSSAGQGMHAASSGAAQRPETAIKRMDEPRSQQELDAIAAAHINAIKERAKKADDNTSAILAAEADPETSASEIANEETAALEKSLLDSISSLTQQLINDPALTTNAISLLQLEENPETMMMIARAIGQAGAAMGDKFPYDLLLKMAENDPSLTRREAAILALGYLSHIPPDLEQRLAEISLTGATPELRMAAVVAMSSWMSQNRDLTAKISDTLLATREASNDPMVRGLVIQSLGNSEVPLTEKGLVAMSHAVVHESEPNNRSLAAVALGSGVSPDTRTATIETLKSAYLSEPTLDTQRHILTQIVKAGREDAEIYLQNLPTPNPLLAQDVKDYIEIVGSIGGNDWGAIWDKKSDLDSRRGTYPSGHGGHGMDSQ